MFSRFLLIFIIAKYLPATDMGTYGLITATIIFSLYVVGLDFYVYSTRELIKTEREHWGRFLKSQCVLSVPLYAIYIPFILLVFFNNLLPWYILPYFLIILFFEHFCQECQRIIIADQKPLAANIGLFIRSGSWPLILIPFFYFNLISRNLDSVLILWIVGDFFAAVFFVYIISNIGISGWRNKVNWTWLSKGVKICSLFLIGTLALKFCSMIERYWLQDLSTIEIVGVYSFFVGISNVISSFVDAGVVSFKYPKLIKAHAEGNRSEALKIKKELAVQLFSWVLVLSLVSLILIDFVLNLVNKLIYFEYKNMYYITLLTAVISCVGLLPHYELYARNKDKIIIFGHVTSLVFFCLSTLIISFFDKVYAVPLGALIMQVYILMFKLISVNRISRNECSYIN
ncbi:hypothetical protein [Pectobacterium polaris]|uniref:hypothetical protein n=1 Tax=Pectobacterium polaris TaxID=2042057 RepID=UPI001583921F|nr:hypothetical protein [Pectobacterium polaris]